jgi:hypothetical protein
MQKGKSLHKLKTLRGTGGHEIEHSAESVLPA